MWSCYMFSSSPVNKVCISTLASVPGFHLSNLRFESSLPVVIEPCVISFSPAPFSVIVLKWPFKNCVQLVIFSKGKLKASGFC